jgi:hypothetical protein
MSMSNVRLKEEEKKNIKCIIYVGHALEKFNQEMKKKSKLFHSLLNFCLMCIHTHVQAKYVTISNYDIRHVKIFIVMCVHKILH